MHAENETWRARIREAAERSIEHSKGNGKEPAFELTEDGSVVCAREGTPATEFYRTLAEGWYWDYVEMRNPGGLIHDGESEGFYVPEGKAAGEPAFSRTRCYLPRFSCALGDKRANPYCLSARTHRGRPLRNRGA